MSQPGLFLEPEMMDALMRQAKAQRAHAMASAFRRMFAWILRRPSTPAEPQAPRLPARLQALLEEHWAAMEPGRR
jgi:hypothetical protein